MTDNLNVAKLQLAARLYVQALSAAQRMVLYHLGYDVFDLKRDDDGRGLLFAILATGAWPLFLIVMVIGAAFALVLTLMFQASKLVANAIKSLLFLG